MPLNRETGEIVGDLGADYIVAPFARYAETPLLGEAIAHATDAFVAAGALLPISIREPDVLIQEYPGSNKLVFLFQRRICGKEHFYPYVFSLPHQMVQALRLVGRWGKPH